MCVKAAEGSFKSKVVHDNASVCQRIESGGGGSTHRPFARSIVMRRGCKAEKNEIAKWRTIVRLAKVVMHLNDNDGEDSSTRMTLVECKSFVLENDKFTRDTVERIFALMLRERYAESYARGILATLARTRCFADARSLMRLRYNDIVSPPKESSIITPMNDAVVRLRGDARVTLKSDGVLMFDRREFLVLFQQVRSDLDDVIFERNTTRDEDDILFLYVFFMLAVTGKRLSDIASLGATELRNLIQYGACVVRIRKTGKLGRVEITELRPDITASKQLNDDDNDAKDNPFSVYIRAFKRWATDDDGHVLLRIPFDLSKQRDRLDVRLRQLFARSFEGREKPRGLSFHALRRAYAGYKFLQGCPISAIQESLEHSSREMTNHYINTCLFALNED